MLPFWCRGDEADCAPTPDATLVIPNSRGSADWVAFGSDRSLHLREPPPWTGMPRRRQLPLPQGFVPKVISASSEILCALSTSGRVRCWLRAEIGPLVPDGVRARGSAVSALFDADNADLVVGPGLRFAASLVCTRTRRGLARCAWLSYNPEANAPPLFAEVAEIHGWIEPVTGLALSTHELCVRSGDGRVACAVGPGRTNAYALSTPITLRPAPELLGASQLAVVPGLGCARWAHGRVRCWGPSLHTSPGRRTRRPVSIPQLEGASQFVAVPSPSPDLLEGTIMGVCALIQGSLRCVGQDRRDHCIHDDRYAESAQSGAPWTPSLRGSFRSVTYHLPSFGGASEEVREGLCGVREDGAIVCERYGPLRSPPDMRWTRVDSADGLLCALAHNGAAWCTTDGTLRRTPALDNFDSLAAVDGAVCALGSPRGTSCVRCDRESGCRQARRSTDRVVGVDGYGCAVTTDGGRRCTPPESQEARSVSPDVMARLGGAVRAVSGHARVTCVLGASGRVACDDGDGAWRIEGPADVRTLAVSGLVCVIRTNGAVACWGDDVAQSLSFAEAGRESGLGVPWVAAQRLDR